MIHQIRPALSEPAYGGKVVIDDGGMQQSFRRFHVMLVYIQSNGLVIPSVFARDLASRFKQDPSRVRSG